MKNLLLVSLRQKAVYLPETAASENTLSTITSLLISRMSEIGYTVSEDLLHALNNSSSAVQQQVLETLQEVSGVNKNWTPLVKAWDTPTGETVLDHIVTYFANLFSANGTRLNCEHIIPEGTFPIERYNGCPYCGTPFELSKLELKKQGSHAVVLELWREQDINKFFESLLSSRTPLDATQADSIKKLLANRDLPEIEISNKETIMLVADALVSTQKHKEAEKLFHSPTDILRFLWYRKTGLLQVVEPKTIINRTSKNNKHITPILDKSLPARVAVKEGMKLKYSRQECAMIASWIKNLDMNPDSLCEMMHPKRDMWVRVIRALRLAEYSKRKGFEKLALILDKFYNQNYPVWAGNLAHYRLKYERENALSLLRQRPGLFARSLFTNLLWFGKDPVAKSFSEIADKVPMRLLLTLQMYAADYFDKDHNRIVRPMGGVAKTIPSNFLVSLYDKDSLKKMEEAVKEICLNAVRRRFEAAAVNAKSIYIDSALHNIPVSIGERAQSVQDNSSALQGTRFSMEGDTVRLFMQWGVGLPAQHLDMDLSCRVTYENFSEICSFSSLSIKGCKHSGDIRSVPPLVGTAEYIDLDIIALRAAAAKYVVFTCNAYSGGGISPNLSVGWMDSKNNMVISEKSGVAYDPSCVQHQVRIVNKMDKGLVFGILDVTSAEITWLELPFQGQIVGQLNHRDVPLLLRKLRSRITIGSLLEMKASAQQLTLVDTPDADEIYTLAWAKDSASVTQLLID